MHIGISTVTNNGSAVQNCSKKRKDPAGFRDEMKHMPYQTGSILTNGTLLSFFIPKEKPPAYRKEFPSLKKGTKCLSSSFIYALTPLFSRRLIKNSRLKGLKISIVPLLKGQDTFWNQKQVKQMG